MSDELLALEGYAPTTYKPVVLVPEDRDEIKKVVRECLGSGTKSRDVVRTYVVYAASIAREKLIDGAAVDSVLQEMADAGEFAEGYGNSGVVAKPPVEPVEVDPPKPKKGEVIDVG